MVVVWRNRAGLRLFFSAGEPSGDRHAAALIGELGRGRARLWCNGFGGPRMAEAGCRLLYPLAEEALVGVTPVVSKLGKFLRLASLADRYFRHHRPDAVVLVDFPGFNWWVARRARFHGIPVFYFLPPQIWAWATWRVAKMRRLVDHALCSLPFEAEWFRQRGVNAVFTGHPYFDQLRRRELDRAFIARHRGTSRQPVVGILPGSRDHEVRRILPVYLRTAARIARMVPQVRFLVACLHDRHLNLVRCQTAGCGLKLEAFAGRTAEIIEASTICLAKSGSVSLELMYHCKPSTILYQVSHGDYALYRFGVRTGIVRAPYITLVNLLAGREVLPEYVASGDVSGHLSRHALRWLLSEQARERTAEELRRLKCQVAEPGATVRAAAYIQQALMAAGSARRAA